ncbi:hypothetical protein [Curtobacterium sp. MCBD17_026]|uniref:hypothetical protein n=1 Tax=Curtobacterium sp. MCBD17_026 TaxID=2175621 RepID=UPI000DA92B87|nr:hypothetical protein [Curtobacterium sp. MCBD17_026]WIB69814.1 hypothetical protein DEI85_11635 [Curtobacterium sp. MCBD17_026]
MDNIPDLLSTIVIPATIALVGWGFTYSERRNATRLVSEIKTTAEAIAALGTGESSAERALRDRLHLSVAALHRRNDPSRKTRIARRSASVLVALAVSLFFLNDVVAAIRGYVDDYALRAALWAALILPLTRLLYLLWGRQSEQGLRRTGSESGRSSAE